MPMCPILLYIIRIRSICAVHVPTDTADWRSAVLQALLHYGDRNWIEMVDKSLKNFFFQSPRA